MIEHNISRTSFATLVICLCLGSLISLSVANTFDLSGVDFGDHHLLDQAEFDDDSFVVNDVGAKNAGVIFLKSSATNLNFQSASLSPIAPPPKHS